MPPACSCFPCAIVSCTLPHWINRWLLLSTKMRLCYCVQLCVFRVKHPVQLFPFAWLPRFTHVWKPAFFDLALMG